MVKTAQLPKKRKLSDLFVVGRDIEIADATEEDPVVVYMRRPNPFEHEEALRDGNAARARMALRMRDPSSDDHDILEGDVSEVGNMEAKRKFIVTERRQDLLTRAFGMLIDPETEDKKWTEKYPIEETQANIDKWLADKISEGDEEWDDYKRAEGVLKEFDEELKAKYEELELDELEKLRDEPDEDVVEMVRKALIDRSASLFFFREYRLACVYFGTRDAENHASRYFTSKQEVKELPYEVQGQLLAAYDALELERESVKNLPSTDPSSQESVQPELVDLSLDSGLVDATV